MFTGLVAGCGRVVEARRGATDMNLAVDLGTIGAGDGVGDSIALSGVCCTVTGMEGTTREFTLTPETLSRTWLGSSVAGDILNIEKPLCSGEPFGGHVVQGHIDGVGEVISSVDPRNGGEWWVRVPRDLCRYCVGKGSIALDGISLTIAAIEEDRLMVAIIPHTAQVTTVGQKPVGSPVNIEVDILAKYVERLIEGRLGGA